MRKDLACANEREAEGRSPRRDRRQSDVDQLESTTVDNQASGRDRLGSRSWRIAEPGTDGQPFAPPPTPSSGLARQRNCGQPQRLEQDLRAAGILICLVLAASADLASAAPVFTVPFGVLGTESGVAVYPSALYTIGAGGRTLVRTHARGRRRPMRQFDRLVRFGDSEMDRGDLTSYSIAVSARWLVVALHREDANQDVRTIMRVARRSGGRARTLVRCPRSSTGPLALRGSLLAVTSRSVV